MHRDIGCALVALASMQCAPPPTLAFEGTQRDPVGTVSAGGFVSSTGDYTRRAWAASPPGTQHDAPSLLADTRVGVQIARDVSVGGELAGAAESLNGNPVGLAAFLGRAHIRVQPDTDHFAVVVGAGGGAGSGAPVLTADVGVRVGTQIHGVVELVASETMSVTGVFAGASVQGLLFTTTDLGVLVKPVPRFGVGAFGSWIYGFGASSMDRPAFVPSFSIRYGIDARPRR